MNKNRKRIIIIKNDTASYNLNYSRIINNIIKFTGGYNKIGLFYSHHNYLHNNSLLSMGGDGIHIYGSGYNNISKNLIKDCSRGLFLERNSSHNLILNNIIRQRMSGIRIYLNCNFNVITNNTLEFTSSNLPMGFDNNGIEIFSSNYENITFNNIAYYFYGIMLYYSNFSYIANNTLFKNLEACIKEFNCNENVFINNECIPISKSHEITGFNFIIIIRAFHRFLQYCGYKFRF